MLYFGCRISQWYRYRSIYTMQHRNGSAFAVNRREPLSLSLCLSPAFIYKNSGRGYPGSRSICYYVLHACHAASPLQPSPNYINKSPDRMSPFPHVSRTAGVVLLQRKSQPVQLTEELRGWSRQRTTGGEALLPIWNNRPGGGHVWASRAAACWARWSHVAAAWFTLPFRCSSPASPVYSYSSSRVAVHRFLRPSRRVTRHRGTATWLLASGHRITVY